MPIRVEYCGTWSESKKISYVSMSDRGAGEILHPIPQWSLFVCTFGFDPCTWSSKEGSEWINATSWCDIYTNLPLLHAGDSINLFRCQKVLSIVPKISKFVKKCSPKLKTSIAFIWYIYILTRGDCIFLSILFCRRCGASQSTNVSRRQGGWVAMMLGFRLLRSRM